MGEEGEERAGVGLGDAEVCGRDKRGGRGWRGLTTGMGGLGKGQEGVGGRRNRGSRVRMYSKWMTDGKGWGLENRKGGKKGNNWNNIL